MLQKPPNSEIQFFCTVSPTELPNIMGLKGIHSPKALSLVKQLACTAPGVVGRAKMRALW